MSCFDPDIMQLKPRSRVYTKDPRPESGFTLKQLRSYYGMPESHKRIVACVECKTNFEAWYEGTVRLERYCPRCRSRSRE